MNNQIFYLTVNGNKIKLKHIGFYKEIKLTLLLDGLLCFWGSTEVYSPSYIICKEDIYYIVVNDSFFTDFNEEEQQIILAHEYGHKYYKGNYTFSDEIKADLYSVQIFGFTKVIEVLKKFKKLSNNETNISERINWILK